MAVTPAEAAAIARSEVRGALRNAAIGYVILLVILVVGSSLVEHRTDTRLRNGAIGACSRLNTERDRVNGITRVVYTAYASGAERESRLAQTTDGVDAVAHRKAAAALRTLQAGLRIQPLTNCKAAVDDPDHYRVPHDKPLTAKDVVISAG